MEVSDHSYSTQIENFLRHISYNSSQNLSLHLLKLFLHLLTKLSVRYLLVTLELNTILYSQCDIQEPLSKESVKPQTIIIFSFVPLIGVLSPGFLVINFSHLIDRFIIK